MSVSFIRSASVMFCLPAGIASIAINLAVSTQWGAFKVGGYYEIELKGAVEAAAPVGADVKPNASEPLARP